MTQTGKVMKGIGTSFQKWQKLLICWNLSILSELYVLYLRLNQTCQYFHGTINDLSTCNRRRIFFSSSNSDSNCLISFLLKECNNKVGMQILKLVKHKGSPPGDIFSLLLCYLFLFYPQRTN